MRIIKNIVIGLVVIIAALALIGFVLPKEYQVERTITVQAPAEVVFDQVNDLKKNEAWSPWKTEDMTISYGPTSAGKGASSSWKSKKMGSGTQTIEESNPSSSIHTHLDFGARGTAKVRWTFVPEGEGTKVTQTMTGDQGMNPIKRWFGLMMDKMMGGYFEKGLASLNAESEKQAAALKTEQAATQQAAVTSAEEGDTPAAARSAPAPAAPAAPAPAAPKAP